MLRDVSYGLRTMLRNPGVTVVALFTLALGIGANTAMFSVIHAVLLRPLPYRDPARLVTIRAQIPSANIFGAFVEYNTFGEWWRAKARSFESMSAFTPSSSNLLMGNEPERVSLNRVNAGFLAMIGVRPALGRDFLAEEDQPGAPRVAIVSDAFWKRRMGAERDLTGRTIVLDRNTHTVVGVLPPDFEFYGQDIDIYVPIAASTARVPGEPSVGVHARLKPGVSLAAAQSEIDALCRGWIEHSHYPADWGARVWGLHEYAVRDVRTSLIVLSAAVGLVLLMACGNVANLLLARAAARQREMAIRTAIGAGRGRLIRQLLTESALLALIAGTSGLLAAWGGVRALAAGSAYLPFQRQIGIDAPVLWFTLLAALLTTVLFGLAPALAATHARLSENLKEGGRAGEGTRGSGFRSSLVVAEVALALLLAICATLTTRSLFRLQAVNPGFRAEGLLSAQLNLPRESYGDPPRRVAFYRSLLERLESMPGVQGAGMVSHLPFSYAKTAEDVTVEGAPPRKPGERLIVFWRSVDPKYFQTLQAPLVRGRFFTARDPSGPPVAIINETTARRCWPGQDPIGKRFGSPKNWLTVVGIVGDMRQTSLAEEPDAEAYMPHAQTAGAGMAVVVRSTMDPMRLAPAIRAAVRELDKDLPVSAINTMTESISHSTRVRRFSAVLLGSFASLALLLAAIGIYGVISYSVTRRTHEIGVRLALGAERGRIAGMVVGRAVTLASVGVGIGIAGGLALTRLVRSMLYGVSATDPAAFTAVSLFLLGVAALAGYIPARRAARVDPMTALREE